MKKYGIFAVLFVLLPFLAQGASTVDPTIPKAPYASSGSCATGYNYKDGYCRWSLDPAPIRNNFAAAYNDITALQNNSLTLSTPITISGACSGTGTTSGIPVTCNSFAPINNPVFTGSLTIPSWTTGTRPASPANGTIGFNSTTSRFEHYNGSWLNWARLSGDTFTGAVGISDATASSSTSTGALTVTGGAGIGGNLNVGGTIAGNGSGLTTLNASNLASGTVPAARLGSGTANSSTVLYGDNVFRVPSGGGGTPGGSTGQIQFNNAGSFGGVTAVPVGNGGTNSTTVTQAQLTLKTRNYAIAANNTEIPNNLFTNANWVMHTATTHYPGAAKYSCPRVMYANWYLGTTSENQGGYDFYLRAGWWDGFQFHRLKFNGQVDVLVSKSYGQVWSDPDCSIRIVNGQPFKIYTRRVAADLGVAGTYNHMTNTSGQTFRQDGLIQGNDPTIDYTMGAGIAYGAVYQTPVITAGAITSIPIDPNNKGINYTAGQNAFCYYGGAGVNQPGSLYPGSGALAGGFCNFSGNNGGTSSTITLGSGGSGYSSGNPPICGCGGTGVAGTGFGTPTSNYGPSAIIAIPDRPIGSVIVDGDSITAGFTSVDGAGDIRGAHGLWEQYLTGKVGVVKVAVSGETLVGRLTAQTRRNAFVQDILNQGTQISHVIIALGVNDFQTNLNSNAVSAIQGYLATLRDIYRGFGVPKIYGTTVIPSVTAGSSKVDQSIMTVTNANYNAGGKVLQYNTALLGGTPSLDAVIDIAGITRDATNTHLPRTDAYAPANKACNTNSNTTVDGLPDVTGLFVGMGVQATGIPAGTTISTIGTTSVTLSAAATATATGLSCKFTTAFLTGDGVHPSVGVGIAYSVANMPSIDLTVP